MSNVGAKAEMPCEAAEGEDGGAIALLLTPREKDLGGFAVRRSLPTARRKMVGPWIFFDHMGPADFPAGTGLDVRPHPHVGLATVTYLFDGEMLHRDSLGSVQTIRPGDINLMVAGRGIVHSEREPPAARDRPRRLHALQLWLALPEADAETEPAFHHYPAADIPSVTVDGVSVRVMMGEAYGVASPVRTFAETLYLEAELAAGQRVTLPPVPEAAVYTVEGSAEIAGAAVPEAALAVLSRADGVTVTAREPARLAVVGGAPLGRRHIDWNFVASTKARIERAKEDWRAGRFPTVPGDDAEFIPLPE